MTDEQINAEVGAILYGADDRWSRSHGRARPQRLFLRASIETNDVLMRGVLIDAATPDNVDVAVSFTLDSGLSMWVWVAKADLARALFPAAEEVKA